ncbi:CbtA family protein [Actinoplanes teichomyceticus]|uniref:Putative cobalt transporter CbtA n=1 Tax=Actinoplanes teichomyceticus TaxID=1867 RepID=A0A561VML9_ACTTI|nr:CbtA family protein [Actinoplanes teichomyceticus]TWG12842.1 putative cobalt transporter CbtA [Actinoplanes teichomyceticus]GIF13589.1 membrane protein [Actinoplanes teichomyceticus]
MPLTPQRKPTFGRILLAGLLAGLAAGLLAGAFAYLAGEPRVEAAIAIEQQNSAPHGEAGHDDGEQLVSRDTQRTIGLPLATGLYGTALGGFLAVGYTLLRRHLRTRSDTRAALGLAAAALLGVVLVPYLKYPPNPPAVGDPATIDQRTTGYLAALALGLVAVWAGVLAARTQSHEWRRATAGVLAFLIVVTVAYTLLPGFDEVPANFPADLLWKFRIASLGTQALLWTALGLGFAGLLHRLATRDSEPAGTVTA